VDTQNLPFVPPAPAVFEKDFPLVEESMSFEFDKAVKHADAFWFKPCEDGGAVTHAKRLKNPRRCPDHELILCAETFWCAERERRV